MNLNESKADCAECQPQERKIFHPDERIDRFVKSTLAAVEEARARRQAELEAEAACQPCEHEWIPFCTACGKPAVYENLCRNCGPIGHEQCVLCWAEKETHQ